MSGMRGIGRCLGLVVALCLATAAPRVAEAELVWDGSPSEAGEEFASASAEFLDAVSVLMAALSDWERGNTDSSIDGYREFRDRIGNARFEFAAIRERFDLGGVALRSAPELENPSQVLTILRVYELPYPRTLDDAVAIASDEMGRVSSVVEQFEFSDDARANRAALNAVLPAVFRALRVGVAVAAIVARN